MTETDGSTETEKQRQTDRDRERDRNEISTIFQHICETHTTCTNKSILGVLDVFV